MGILSWFKNRKKHGDAEEVRRAQNEYFDTPEEQRIGSGNIEAMRTDYAVGMLGREELPHDTGPNDPEERLAEEEER
jgi:hypothetical protein